MVTYSRKYTRSSTSQIEAKAARDFSIFGRVFDGLDDSFSARELTIRDGRIISITNSNETDIPYIIPPFRNAHNHIESTQLPPREAARMLVAHGTDAMVSDPHELANVLGPQGVEFMLRESSRAPQKFSESPVYFAIGIPSCVPASPLENSGAIMDQHTKNIYHCKDIRTRSASSRKWPSTF